MSANKPILLTVIVEQSYDDEVAAAFDMAGIGAWTRFEGTGTGVWETLDRWVDPQKYIYQTVITAEQEDRAFSALLSKAGLDRPGVGIAFTHELRRTAGVGVPRG
jgi:hypothetical protein